ncbi:hypothetical protein D3C87_1511490 [compost metagenome]
MLLGQVVSIKTAIGIGQIVVCRCYFRTLEGDAFQAFKAIVQLAAFLEDNSQVAPGTDQRRIQSNGLSTCLFSFDQQPLLSAHFRQIAEITSLRTRCLARLAHVSKGQVQPTKSVCYQPEQMQSIGLLRPLDQYTLTQPLGLWCLSFIPMRIRQYQGLRHCELRAI